MEVMAQEEMSTCMENNSSKTAKPVPIDPQHQESKISSGRK